MEEQTWEKYVEWVGMGNEEKKMRETASTENSKEKKEALKLENKK